MIVCFWHIQTQIVHKIVKQLGQLVRSLKFDLYVVGERQTFPDGIAFSCYVVFELLAHINASSNLPLLVSKCIFLALLSKFSLLVFLKLQL